MKKYSEKELTRRFVCIHSSNRSPDAHHWQAAIETEIQHQRENGTWKLVKLPPGRIALTGRWVFRIKYGLDGSILKYKARWVVHGFKQIQGIDYYATCAGVVKPASFRILFAIAAAKSLRILQLDIVTAFLYGLLDEEIYVKQPDGFIKDQSLVCLLIEALYGLKQAPRVWYGVITNFLKSLGFECTDADLSVFYTKDRSCFICVYVDDLLLFGGNLDCLNALKAKFMQRFKMTDLGPIPHYLGMSITHEQGRITLNQATYFQNVLRTLTMACSMQGFRASIGLFMRVL